MPGIRPISSVARKPLRKKGPTPFLLWEGGVRRVKIWGQSLEAKSHRVQQSDQIQEGQESESSNLRVLYPVLNPL